MIPPYLLRTVLKFFSRFVVFVRACNKTNKEKLLKTARVTDILFASHLPYIHMWVILRIIQQQIMTGNELEIKRKK